MPPPNNYNLAFSFIYVLLVLLLYMCTRVISTTTSSTGACTRVTGGREDVGEPAIPIRHSVSGPSI